MHKQLPTLLCSFLLAAHSVCAASKIDPDPLPAPQDFAYAVPLQFNGQDAIYQTTLPLSVYQHTVRSDLGDLRVFNGAGEMVPHMLLQAADTTLEPVQTSRLNLFPLTGNANEGLDQLSIRIKRNAAGTLINLNSNAQTAGKAHLTGYLLDASALKHAIQALELDWSGTGDNFVGSVQIEASDDLQHWRTIVSNAPLARLNYGGQQLQQKQVSFIPVSNKYLRLSWPAQQAPLQLHSVTAELAAQRSDAPLNWQSAIATSPQAGEYAFDLGTHLPLRRLRFTLPQNNTLVQAALLSRSNPGDNWQLVSNCSLYQLHHSGQDLRNADLRINSQQRYWLLRVEQKNGGLGNGMPELQAGWQPQQLQFVTRGNPPFQLAYGSSHIKPATFNIQGSFPTDDGSRKLEIPSAQTGAQLTLGGDTRLAPAQPELQWKKWILWSVLICAVFLLGWMAYRLTKQMNNGKLG